MKWFGRVKRAARKSHVIDNVDRGDILVINGDEYLVFDILNSREPHGPHLYTRFVRERNDPNG